MSETATAPAPTPAGVPTAAPPAAPLAAPTAAPPAAAAPTPAPAPPQEIAFKLPANHGLRPEYLDGLRGVAGEHKIGAEQAQAVLDFHLAQRAVDAKAAADAETATRASWDAALAKDYPGSKLAEASDAIKAYVHSRAPELEEYLIGRGVYRFPGAFKLFASLAASAAETGTMKQGVAPAQAAANPQDDLSKMFNHPTSQAELARSRAGG